MKEFIEKLIERLEESQERYDDVAFAEMNENGQTLDFEYAHGKKDGVSEAIEIINELAEEYKGGWILVSERLPKANIQVIVTAEKSGHRYTTDAYFHNGKFYDKHYYKIPVGELNDSSVGDKVIAWQPLPAPYKEGCE